jgi:hypothetical protein
VSDGKERFLIELVALPDKVPAASRLKRFLKHALRGYALKCTGIREIKTVAADETTRKRGG